MNSPIPSALRVYIAASGSGVKQVPDTEREKGIAAKLGYE
jgi:hypothetical protein